MLICEVCRCHVLLVFSLEVHTLLDQEVNHVILVSLDGIVDRSLSLEIWQVMVSPPVDQELGDLDLAFPHTVVQWSLPIFVLSIDLCTLVNQQLRHCSVTLSGCIEERTLLEQIFLDGIDSHLNENIAHLEGYLMIGDNRGKEHWSLAEILRLVQQTANLNACLSNQAHQLINLSLLDEVKNLLLQVVTDDGRWSIAAGLRLVRL